jgi:hypothetical protein
MGRLESFKAQRRTPALAACLSLHKLANHTTKNPPTSIALPPTPLALPRPLMGTPPLMHHDPALAPTLDICSEHQAKLNKLSKDPKQIARSLKRALTDAQELIGKCPSPTASDSKHHRAS